MKQVLLIRSAKHYDSISVNIAEMDGFKRIIGDNEIGLLRLVLHEDQMTEEDLNEIQYLANVHDRVIVQMSPTETYICKPVRTLDEKPIDLKSGGVVLLIGEYIMYQSKCEEDRYEFLSFDNYITIRKGSISRGTAL